jgi:CRISPR-associated endonuclease/helicase Cas3
LVNEFDEFYGDVYSVIKPNDPRRKLDPWQRAWAARKYASILAAGRNPAAVGGDFPEIVAVPTGSGKSVVMIEHVFACSVFSGHPARLVLTAPRRNLVDQHVTDICDVQSALGSSAASPLMRRVRDTLTARRVTFIDANTASPRASFIVATLRGGTHGERHSEWMNDPNACAIIVATIQSAVSTVIARSYIIPLRAHSTAAGLLGVGTHIVVDEAHLSRQAVSTLRSVARMVNTASIESGIPHGLWVTEMTATPSDDMALASAIRLTHSDVSGNGSHIGKTLTAAKMISVRTVDDSSKTEGANIRATAMADAAVDMLNDLRKREVGGTVAVVVNVVKEAYAVADLLRASGHTVLTLTGRMRSSDRQALFDMYPGALTGGGDVEFIVSTQVIEVGIDADFAGMVTALCSADALVQRIGRDNRHGNRDYCPVVVIVPENLDTSSMFGRTYTPQDVKAALEWVNDRIMNDNGSVSPYTVYASDVPVRRPNREVIETYRRSDAMRVFLTCDQAPSVYDDPEFWISEDLVPDTQSRIILRRASDAVAKSLDDQVSLLETVRPRDGEAWTISSSDAEKIIRRLLKEIKDVDASKRAVRAVGVRAASGRYRQIVLSEDGKTANTVEPNSRETPLNVSDLMSNTVIVWTNGGKVPLIEGGMDTGDGTVVGGVVSVNGKGRTRHVDEGALLNGGCVLFGTEIPEPDTSDIAYARERWTGRREMEARYWSAVRRKVGDDGAYVTLSLNSDNQPIWAVSVPWKSADDDVKSTETESTEPVLLSSHRRDVADTCEALSSNLGVPPIIGDGIRDAGLYHDDGKSHIGFQRYLAKGFPNEKIPVEVAVAKAPNNFRLPKTVIGLPAGWRHEQLSAAIAAHELRDEPHRALSTVLAGLTHGFGRLSFPHGWASLMSGENSFNVEDIFTDGTWDEWVIALNNAYGPWHLAWMEAVVRAADHHVSAQGH